MSVQRFQHSFSLTNQEETDLITAQSKHSIAEIIRAGIKWGLRDCPKPSKKLLEKVEKLV